MFIEQSEFAAGIGILSCIFCGYFLKLSLIIAKQRWVENFNATITFLTLPVITFVITKVISNNIALSLGMVGALSIVRFRNPVKNSLELVMYFSLITVGIANSVNLKWGITLTIVLIFIILIINIFKKSILVGKNLNLSFSEGDQVNNLEVKSNSVLKDLEDSKFLITMIKEKNNFYYYFLNSNDKKDIENLYIRFKDNPNIEEIKVQYV